MACKRGCTASAALPLSGVDMIDVTVVPKELINLTLGTTVTSIIIIYFLICTQGKS